MSICWAWLLSQGGKTEQKSGVSECHRGHGFRKQWCCVPHVPGSLASCPPWKQQARELVRETIHCFRVWCCLLHILVLLTLQVRSMWWLDSLLPWVLHVLSSHISRFNHWRWKMLSSTVTILNTCILVIITYITPHRDTYRACTLYWILQVI